MSDRTYSKQVGDIGENIVLEILKNKGLDARLSKDEYDQKGDIYIFENNQVATNVRPFEVKTQLPKIFGRDSERNRCETFTIHIAQGDFQKESQEEKSRKAEIVFVQIPYLDSIDENLIKVWKKPHDVDWIKSYNRYHKSTTYEVPIKECEFIGAVNSQSLIELRDSHPRYTPGSLEYDERFIKAPQYEVTLKDVS
jgi:hypothetical protein